MLIVTRGLPASGKTTLAKMLGITRVNRDSVRLMLHGGFVGTDEAEHEVSIVQSVAVSALLRARVSVCVDDCNLYPGSLEEWYALAKDYSHQFVIYDLTGVDVEVCVARSAGRGVNEAGEAVIRRMHARYFPLPELDESMKRHIRSAPSPPSEEIKMAYEGEHEIDATEVVADENPAAGTPADEAAAATSDEVEGN